MTKCQGQRLTVTVCMYCPQLPQAHSVLLQAVQLNFCHLPDSKAQQIIL